MGSDSDFGAFIANPASLFDGFGVILLIGIASVGLWLVVSSLRSSSVSSTPGSSSPLLDLAGLTRTIAPKLQSLDASLSALGVGIEDRAEQIERHLADAINSAKSEYVAAVAAAAKAKRTDTPTTPPQ